MDDDQLKNLTEALAARRSDKRYRQRLVLESAQGPVVTVAGQSLLSFCSNDYLGLAADTRLAEALCTAASDAGTGAGAAHLISGHHQLHHQLEQELAAFVGAERALLFSTGYMANLGVVSALLGRHDLVIEDRLNHASLIDAARLSRARVKRYRHADSQHAAALLAGGSGRMLVTSDAVFSMDGDLAPLTELATVVEDNDGWLLVDDAHGFGVLGSNGRGTLDHLQVPRSPRILMMGTLGKACGTFGAFVAGDATVVDTLIQQARTYIYTTALPPPVAAATRASLKLLQTEDWRRQQLFARVRQFRDGARALGLQLTASPTPIQPLIIGDSTQALAVSMALRDRGILVPAIRPPTVAAGSARLRITLSAVHSELQVDRLLDTLGQLQLPAEARQ